MKDWIRSVLIVHSDIHVAKALASSIVEGHEVYVYIAGMGERVREFLRSIGVDLVIASQKLPDMTGMELFSQLSLSNPWVRRVLLLSGEEEVNGDDAVRQGLIHYYMMEPIETPAILHVIKENIQGRKVAGGPETETPGHDESPVYPPDGRGAGQPEERPGSTWEWEETSSRAVHVAPAEHPVEGLCPESSFADRSPCRESGAPSDDVASAHDQRHVEPERAREEEIASEILQDEYPQEEASAELLEEQEELFREADAVLEQRPIDYQKRRDADEGVHADDAGGWVEAAPSAVLESETLPMEPLGYPEHTDADEAEHGMEAEPSAILELEDAQRESLEEAQPEPLGEPVEEHREEDRELEAVCQRLGRENEQLRNSLDQLRFENAALLIARQTSAPQEEASPSGARERELLEQQAASMRLEIEHLQAELSEARGRLEEAASVPHAKEALMAAAEISCLHGAVEAADQASERHRELCRLQRLNTVLDLGLQKKEHELSDLNEEIERLRRHLESMRIRFEKDLRECRQNCVILKKGKEIQEERCGQLERDNAELLRRLAWVQEAWRQFSSHEPESKP